MCYDVLMTIVFRRSDDVCILTLFYSYSGLLGVEAPLPKNTGLPSLPPEGESTEGSLGVRGAGGTYWPLLVTYWGVKKSYQCNRSFLGASERWELGNVVPKKFYVSFTYY